MRALGVRSDPRPIERGGGLGLGQPMDDLEDMELTFRDRLDAIGPEARAVLLHVLKLPDLERVRSISEFFADPRTRTFAALLVGARGLASSSCLRVGRAPTASTTASDR